MAFDEKLAARIRRELAKENTLEEIKMFGGLCFKVNGRMACGVMKDELIVKVDPERHDLLMEKPHAKEFDFTRKPMRGILVVKASGVTTAPALRGWLKEGLEFTKSVPAKKKKSAKRNG